MNMISERKKILDEGFINSEAFGKTTKKNATYYKVAFHNLFQQPENNKAIQEDQLIKEQKGKFNWPAGLFSYFWFAYRKMWKWAFVVLALETVLFATIEWARPINDATGNFSTKGVGTFIGAMIVIVWSCGSYANSYYFKHLQSVLAKSSSDDEVYLATGTSWPAVFGMVAIAIIVGVFQAILF